MEAQSGRTPTRLIVVDFVSTLFVAFCIGVATALVLGACVVLMSGDARGVAPESPPPAADARTEELVLAHHLASRYAGLVGTDRAAVPGTGVPARDPSGHVAGRQN